MVGVNAGAPTRSRFGPDGATERGRTKVAQKTIVELVDDLDGSTADETLTFALDGTVYEIDLKKAHADLIRNELAPYMSAGRKATGGAPGRGRGAISRRRGQRDDRATEIRAWARAHGFQVSDRGRISREVVDAYEAAH